MDKEQIISEKDRRFKLVGEIFLHATKLNANKSTIVFLLATMNDKRLTKFHKEFLTTK